MTGTTAAPHRHDTRIGANAVRTGIALGVTFALIATGAGYWQVLEAQKLSTAPDNPAVIAIARRTLRGTIVDRNGTWLARSVKDANGEAQRQYRDRSLSGVLGYASARYGTAGLERAYNSQLLGIGDADPVHQLTAKFDPKPVKPLTVALALDLRLQKAAVAGLAKDTGAVVMLDPASGEILALASTPTYDEGAIADPATADDAFAALQANPNSPLLPRATQGRFVPGSVFKIVTAIAGLDSGAITDTTTFSQQPGAEAKGLLVDGFRIKDGHHPATGGTALDLIGATEVSCNIWYALAGLAIGGGRLVEEAAKLGFGAPIPFDLPTAVSRLNDGTGSAPGGFADNVELASAAFGQAGTFVTPLQMALVAAAVANDGVLMRPHLVTALQGTAGGARTIGPETWNRVMTNAQADLLKTAMQQAVEGDLGRMYTVGAAVPGIPTAGKTGTAQVVGSPDPHSWFIGFAPVDHPKVVIAVLVANGGHGAERAAPLAGALMAKYFALYGNP